MQFASTVEFAQVARRVSRAAVRRGLVGPSFRCPPRLVGVDRTIRRRPEAEGGGAVVSIRVKGRPSVAVLADMIEGVVVANGLVAPEADRLRNELWAEAETSVLDAATPRNGAA